MELDRDGETRQFSSVDTPADMFATASAESHVLDYIRLPVTDDAAPNEIVRIRYRTTSRTSLPRTACWDCMLTYRLR